MILTINKNGEITQRNIKNYDNLYSICNYRNNNNFELLYVWNNEYYLYGKNNGRSGYENNYKFPNITEVFYGNLCIIKQVNNEYMSLTIKEWDNFCNKPLTNTIIDKNTIEDIDKIINDVELTYEEYEIE